MSIVGELRDLLDAFEVNAPDMGELERLRSFYERMKREGIAKTRDYDLPQLDTIGRMIVQEANGRTRK